MTYPGPFADDRADQWAHPLPTNRQRNRNWATLPDGHSVRFDIGLMDGRSVAVTDSYADSARKLADAICGRITLSAADANAMRATFRDRRAADVAKRWCLKADHSDTASVVAALRLRATI